MAQGLDALRAANAQLTTVAQAATDLIKAQRTAITDKDREIADLQTQVAGLQAAQSAATDDDAAVGVEAQTVQGTTDELASAVAPPADATPVAPVPDDPAPAAPADMPVPDAEVPAQPASV